MKGKILEYGVILGDDGRKYSFSYDDIMNLSQKGRQKLENLRVDFIQNDESATEIYLLIKENSRTENEIQKAEFKNAESDIQNSQSSAENSKITRRKTIDKNAQNSSQNANEFSNKAQNESENSTYILQKDEHLQITQVASIKRKAYIMMICYTLYFLIVPLVVAVVFHIKLVLELQRVSHSKTLLRNLILSIAALLVAFAVAFIFSILFGLTFREIVDFNEMADMDRFFTRRFLDGVDEISIIIFLLIGYVFSFYFDYLYSKELAYTTNQPYFMRSFWLSLTASIFSGISEFVSIFAILSTVLYIACFYFYIKAWINFKEIIIKEK